MKDQPTRDPQVGLKALDKTIAEIKKLLSQFEQEPVTVAGTSDRPVKSETDSPLELET